MKLKELLKVVNPDTDICLYSAITKNHLGRFTSDCTAITKYEENEIDNISGWACKDCIDVEIKTTLEEEATKHQKQIMALYSDIFSDNNYYYDGDKEKFVINGVDTPSEGYIFCTLDVMVNAMESDIKEALLCEVLNRTLADFATDLGL